MRGLPPGGCQKTEGVKSQVEASRSLAQTPLTPLLFSPLLSPSPSRSKSLPSSSPPLFMIATIYLHMLQCARNHIWGLIPPTLEPQEVEILVAILQMRN